jgi:hypothetical protein
MVVVAHRGLTPRHHHKLPTQQIAHADIATCSGNSWNGAWSAFPFFSDGLVAISSIEQGLFLLRVNLPSTGLEPGPNRFVPPERESMYATLEPATTTTPAPTTPALPKSCADLGWAIYGTSTDVCAQSTIGGRCKRRTTFLDAKNTCEGVGARLCTVGELEADAALGSGCSLDSVM